MDEYDPMQPINYSDICAMRLKDKMEREHYQQERRIMSNKNVGRKMLEKMGWKEGERLGKEKKGLIAPLIARKIDDRAGVIIENNARPIPKNTNNSRIMIITNIPPWPKEQLEDSVVEAASDIGNLLRIELCDKAIYCEFETVNERNKAVANFNGHILGGRNLRASVWHSFP